MYHSSVKSIFVEEQNDVPPICPKPRKLGSTTTLPEFLKSLNCNDNRYFFRLNLYDLFICL